MDEIQAAILSVKLRHLDEDIECRQKVAEKYVMGITNSSIILPSVIYRESHVFHVFPILTDKRESLQRYLLQNNIQTVIHYPIPPHKQECYSGLNSMSLPITEKIHNEELSLPISPVLSEEQIAFVIDKVNGFNRVGVK